MKKAVLLTFAGVLVGLANAGWTVVVHEDNSTMPALLNDGYLVKASNLGSNAEAQMIDGISYDIDYSNITGANPASTEWSDGKFYTGTDAAMFNLLNTGGMVLVDGSTTMTFTFTGLTIGEEYRFQLLLGGGWGGCAANLYGNNWSGYQYVYFGDGSRPRLATYTWTADATERIIRTNAGSGQARHFNLAYAVHNLVPMQANTPTPAKGATNAGVLSEQPGKADVLLTWQPGLDPENPDEPYPLIRDYYLYLSEDQTISSDPNLNYIDTIDSGYPDIDQLSQYGPLELNLDGAYLWRVDTGVALDGGGVSGPDDPNTIVGSVWAFETLSSVPIITAQPASVLLEDAGESGAFSFTVSTVSPAQYQWYRSDELPVYDEESNVMVPAGSPVGNQEMIFPPGGTGTLSDVQLEGFYYCKVWNDAGQDNAVYTNVVTLGIKQQMAHWTLDGLVNDQYADQTGNFHADPNNPALVEFVDGIRDDAVKVDQNSFARVDAALDPTLYTNQITLSAWIRVTGELKNTDGQGIVSKRDDGGSDQWRWSFYARGRDGDWANSVRFQTWNSGDAWSNPNSVPQGEWAHVAAVVGADRVGRVYVNGLQNGNTQGNWNWGPKADAPVTLGRWTPTTSLLPGDIDDIRIWNYGKDKYGIADLYYAETGKRVCIDPLPPEIAIFDVNNDCIVDMLDFVEFASTWLACGLYPVCD